jgi:hypothetical protein
MYAALMAISERLAGPSSATQIQLYPQPAMWWFFPGFGAFCLAWDVRVLLWSLFGNSRKARLYRIWAKRKTAGEQNVYAASPFNRWCIRLFVLPMALCTVLALNMHATVGPENIRDCGYAFKPCTVLPYADLRRTTYVAGRETSGSRTGASLVLDFKNGRRWSTGNWGDEIDDVDPAIVSLLHQNSALPLAYVNRIEEIPPLANSLPAEMK